ncbi:ABC-three component system middle component 7 [Sporosarcina sp. Marseille-Q4943]|uniref:ABC-three component system middle component 7 n=1 Tax=Sporosarcina sp. Marseille-Q4943 TaxID=2942204 RepID=UPI00208DBCD8|nr:ABC-three component system middle component 7 [Sporosarcina sp. Marseille-Q4943]
MLVPNKVITFNDSIIGKMTFILDFIIKNEMTIQDLYFATQEHFGEIDEFIYSLDVLFLLDAIKVDFNKGVVSYVKRD